MVDNDLSLRTALSGPRLLLRRLREVMAEPINPQSRLDKIVNVIAANMIAEVCSLYIMHADGSLELCATEGLNATAVHATRMRAGEGLVGLIAQNAEPLALANAQAHPSFSYRQETGEEIYHSFLGVPVLRGGNTLGVLVVQNRSYRSYSEEEIEALQTTAMLLAEMVVSGELQSLMQGEEDIALRRSLFLKGTVIADGIGLGHVLLREPRLFVRKIVADDVQQEIERLDEAIAAMRHAIDRLIDVSSSAQGIGEHSEVLEAFRMFAHDRGWLRRLREAVMTGLTAEAAVERVQNDARAKLQRQTDPYLRDRLHDLDDLANRLLHELTGHALVRSPDDIPDNTILVARALGPAALLDYDRTKLRGLVLEDAGVNSHVAIVARALGIPAVGDVANIVDLVEPGDSIIVDGTSGDVQLRPQADVVGAYRDKARMRAKRQQKYRKLRHVPTVTKDGLPVTLAINAGLLVDMPHLEDTGASGIGLFRTELQFMLAAHFPKRAEQRDFYRAILEAVDGKPVNFRTLDIGGDKILPYMTALDEPNPALGWRAIRIGLDRPGLMRIQLRALIQAGAGFHLRIMFPMITQLAELHAARALVRREEAHLRRHGHALPASIKLGAMIEVPALLFELDEIAREADFLSVGSNDLIQYFFASDRENKRVASRFDPLSVSSLRALKLIAEAGARHDKPVTLCGELSGRPLEAMALLALGYQGLSMSPAAIGPIRAMVLSVHAGRLRECVHDLLVRADPALSIRERLTEFAAQENIALG